MSTTTLVAGKNGVESGSLARSMAYCREVARRQARNFYYGLKLTPEPKRSAICAVYAWMRAADDLADEPGDADVKAQRLEVFRQRTVAEAGGAGLPEAGGDRGHELIWPALRHTVNEYDVPVGLLHAMIDGQLLDQHKTRYETFDELYDYCYKVASVVGLVCIKIWGYTGGRATEQLAEQRGVALQLTNILRDLVEDAKRGRLYLPAQELREFGYDPDGFREQLLSGEVGEGFDRLMTHQVARAQRYYEMSAGLEQQIDPACRATSWAMVQIYQRLLKRIAAGPRRVLRERVRLGGVEKFGIALRAAWSGGF